VVHRGSFSHLVNFSRQEFIAYLLTRSNTLAALAQERETESATVDWLEAELSAIVPDETSGSFIFKCNLWLMRAAGAD
jgi:primosomal protein N''